MRWSTCFFALITCSVAVAQPTPPSYPAYGFGRTLDDTHGATLIAASAGRLWIWYAHSGHDEAIPAPGVLRLSMIGPDTGARSIVFRLKNPDREVHATGYPSFNISVEDARLIAGASEVTVELRWPARDDAPERLVSFQMTPVHLIHLGRVLAHGNHWSGPNDSFTWQGVSAYIVDTRLVMKPYLELIKGLLETRTKALEGTQDEFSLHFMMNDTVERRPDPHRGVGRYTSTLRADAAKAIGEISAKGIGGQPLKELLRSALNQKALTILYLTTDGEDDLNAADMIEQLNAHGARLIVHWFGSNSSKSVRRTELMEIVTATGGLFIEQHGSGNPNVNPGKEHEQE